MSIPTHGPSCQTLVYGTSCWYCQQEIFVLQCSCGSAVLFDELGAPWPKHACAGGGIGGSGLSGWTAVDALRAQGAPISSDVMAKIFPGNGKNDHNVRQEITIRKIEPERDSQRSLLAVVRELNQHIRRTKDIAALSDLGIKLLGLDPRIRYRQITLVNNEVRPNESHTALVPDHLARSLRRDAMVMADMHGGAAGNIAVWVVTDINPL